MCGICGKYSPGGVTPAELTRMVSTLVHRGPDDEGWYADGPVGLASRRLSIIDLEGGHMPLSNEDGSVWVVYNGEIYNHEMLREDLQRRGHRFRSRADTEVIVHLYEEMGERCVERLSGMFAFALWDANRRKLVLARDRIGQKPLFYAQEGEDLLFASELKAILAVSRHAPEADHESMHHYLSLRFVPAPGTMVRGVKKLPPAHLLVYQDGRITISQYWDLSFRDKLQLSAGEAAEAVRERLRKAVKAHLVSDVPVGAFLSGGLDSSMIVALVGKDLGLSVKTFAIGTEAPDFDELPQARLVADHCGTRHVEERVRPDLIQLLPKMIWHLDEPSDPIAACQYHAAALASRHVKVALGGDGGDELFAGFDRYLGLRYVDYYARLPALIRRKVLGPLLQQVPDSFAYKSLAQKLRWLHQLSALPGAGARYAEATCFFRFNHRDKALLYGETLWKELRDLNAADVITDQFNSAPADDDVDRMLYADFMTRLPEHSLMLSDRMSMAHSLELRSPYLDHELVEFMAAIPAGLKIKKGELKHVLRQVARDYLPQQIVARKKHGFMFPVAYWFRGPLYPFLRRFLLDAQLVREGFFRKEQLARLLEDHRSGRVDNHVRLWMLLNLEVWHRMYVASEAREAVEEGIAVCA